MNNNIKFSHVYQKLLIDKKVFKYAKLLEVINIDIENLSKEFLEYDTANIYKLPNKGKFLLLIFQKSDHDIFTTLRANSEKKNTYYKSRIGQFFEIILKEVV